MEKTAIVVVDIQNDFCAGGSLAVTGAEGVLIPANRVIEDAVKQGWDIYVSRDWHPAKTKHFDKWPVHCVQGTPGAEFHPMLHLPTDYDKLHIVSKGLGDADDYSAFDAGMRPDATKLIIFGLATDYCVLWTVKKARELGYEVVVLLDAIRGVELKHGDIIAAISEMVAAGATFAHSNMVCRGY